MALLGLAVMCIICSINAASLEPICSKFSYEEQLLEKMVRLEFFVENMNKDVKASVTANKNEMEKTKTTVRGVIYELETKVEEVLTNMTFRNDKMLNEMNEDIKSVGKKFEDFRTSINEANDKFIKGINEEVKNIEKKVDDLKTNMEDNILKTIEKLMDKKYPVVAFNVYGISKGYSGTVMPFKTIRLNEGSGFSTHTNKFTAPVTGIYQFNAHVCSKKGNEIEYILQAGSKTIITGEYIAPNAGDDGKCTSFSAVGLLQKSETAYIGGISSSRVHENIGDDVNSFSGFLIRAI